MLVLGIESSCDETSAALVKDGHEVINSVVHTQIELHREFNGVVPEIASRDHLSKIIPVIDEAMQGTDPATLDAIAVANGPGLVGALLVGLSTAKALSMAWKKPLVPVNHVEAHLYAPHLVHDIGFPYIGLVASGGHTVIFECLSHSQRRVVGSTIDDAVGEAFDKTAKILGLGYPGGPAIDKASFSGNPSAFELPLGLADKGQDRYRFSYSGLKTAVSYRMKDRELTPQTVADMAASFQKSAIDLLFRKVLNAARDLEIRTIVIAGGVAANSYLRSRAALLSASGYSIYTAPLEYCGDNAAMVAGRGTVDFKAGVRGGAHTEVFSRLPFIIKGKRS